MEELLNRIETLERKLAEKEKQQITFPLDENSIRILNRYFMRISGTIQTVGGAGGNEFIDFIGKQDNLEFFVNRNPYIPYTADASADTITVNGAIFEDGNQVVIATSDTAPAGLTAGTTYYVVNSTSNGTVFKLSATFGGSAINITSAGTGRQYISYLT